MQQLNVIIKTMDKKQIGANRQNSTFRAIFVI